MPVFEVQGPDGKTYEMEGPSMDWAVSTFKGLGKGPSESSNKAADMLVRYATGGAGIKNALEKAGEHAKGLMTGEVPPTPENVLPAATLGLPASPLPVKFGFRGPPGAGPNLYGAPAASPAASIAPVGPPTARTLGEVKEAATEALLQPTGTIPSQGKAGSVIQRAMEPRTPPRTPSPDDWMGTPGGPTKPMAPGSLDEWIYQSKGAPSEEWIRRARTPGDDWTAGMPKVSKAPEAPAAIEPVPQAIRDLFPGRGGDAMGHLHDLAKNDPVTLGQVMRAVPEAERPIVQGAFSAKLGGGAGAKGPAGIDPIALIRGYGELPEVSRGIIYGEAGKSSIRTSLDSILNDYTTIAKLGVSKEGGAAIQPLELLANIVRQGQYGHFGHAILRDFTSPHFAASIAMWSRAVVRWLTSKTPASIAALTIATRNLENTIGSAEAGTRSIADINKPLPEEEEARRRIRERLLDSGRTELPIERMRQSTMMQDRRGVTPPRPDIRDLLPRQPYLATGDFRRRILGEIPIPIGPMETDAGVPDIRPRGRRGFAEGGQFEVPDYDPFERAAQRNRAGVIGRQEGRTSQVIDAIGRGLAHEGTRILTIPKRFIEAGMIPDEEDRREAIRKVGGELAGTGAELMFGPKGTGTSAKVVGSFAGAKGPVNQSFANKVADLLPAEWTVTPSNVSSNFYIHGPNNKFIGIIGHTAALKDKKYLFTPAATTGGVKSKWGMSLEELLPVMHGNKGPTPIQEPIHKGEMTKAEMKEWSDKVAADIGKKITFEDIKTHAHETIAKELITKEPEKMKIRGKTYVNEDNKWVGIEESKQYKPEHRTNLADLPPMLPEAELEAARQAGGYTTPAYRGRQGGSAGRREPDVGGEPIFSAANPDLAGLYAGINPDLTPYKGSQLFGGHQTQPLLLDTRNYLKFDAQGADWSTAQQRAFPKARKEGKSGVIMYNVLDEPIGNYAGQTVLGPQTVYATFDPKTRKSKFARQFDPESRDMLKARLLGSDPTLAGIATLDPGDYEGRR
jgi:hypothetical protein